MELTVEARAAQAREQLSAALDKKIHDAQEECMWDNANGITPLKAAQRSWLQQTAKRPAGQSAGLFHVPTSQLT